MLVWKCPQCGNQLSAAPADAGKEFTCPSCNAKSTAPVATVPTAPTTPPPIPPTFTNQVFLAAAQPGMRPARCSRLVFILLAIFLGKLGIHNFVAGYTTRGIIQLSITGVAFILFFCTFGMSTLAILGVWIWALTEIVTTTKDADGVTMP